MNATTHIKPWIVCAAILLGLHFSAAAREDWERLMDFDKPKNAAEQKAWDLLKECRRQGSEGARRLIAEMPHLPLKYRDKALDVLALTRSAEAREYLLSLALSTCHKYAALVYIYKSGNPSIYNSGDPTAARNLLQSTNREIQAIAVQGLLSSHRSDSIQLDRRAWEVVKGLLSSENLQTRSVAAGVAGRDSGNEVPAAEKAQALVGALRGIETLPEAQHPTAYGVHTFLRGAHYEFVCLSIITALGDVRGLEAGFLRQQSVETTGVVRDCVLLARGRRGDEQAKEELRRLAREHPSAAFRWEAVGRFFKLGTTEDLLWLQDVAARDPFYIEKWLPGKFASPEDEIPRDYYSVRDRAQQVMADIRRRAEKTSPAGTKPAEK